MRRSVAAAAADLLLRVGLTGAIGAGKSTVAGMLAQHGCHVLDLDALGHSQLRSDGESFAEIVAAFGDAIVGADGEIDRKALAARIFGDPQARRRLEGIVHPRIVAAEERELRGLDGIAVSEAALLVETGGWQRYHRLVVVVAHDAVRTRRLLARGMSADDIDARQRAQLPQNEKAAVAAYVIDNSAALAATAAQIAQLMERLAEDLDDLTRGRGLRPRSRR